MYKPLIYYNHNSQIYEQEYTKRINDYASIRLPFKIQPHNHSEYFETFYVNHSSLDELNYKIYRNSRKICNFQHLLPTFAMNEYSKKLILEEIVSTNKIEGIQIDEKKLQSAFTMFHYNKVPKDFCKIQSNIKMYTSLTEDRQSLDSPEDIRNIYNQLIYNESDPTTFLDGVLFRSEPVYLTTKGGKILHKGTYPESSIISNLESLISYLKNHQSDFLYKISIAHYFFGFVHPFYDGNGRTSRFISSMLLRRELDLFTALSLSRIIEINKYKYYEAFDITNNFLNKGELTFFCMHFMQIIYQAQTTIIDELSLNQDKLKRFDTIILKLNLPNEKHKFILSIIASNYIFGIQNRGITKLDLIDYSKINHRTLNGIIKQLHQLNLIKYVKKNPLSITISEYLQYLFEN